MVAYPQQINKINVISRDKKTYIICLIEKIKQGDVFSVNKIRIFNFFNIETFKPQTEVLPSLIAVLHLFKTITNISSSSYQIKIEIRHRCLCFFYTFYKNVWTYIIN